MPLMIVELMGASMRERTVFQCLLDGQTEKVIAAELRLSTHTVHAYTRRIYRRLQVKSRPELLAVVVKRLETMARTTEQRRENASLLVL